MCAPGAGVGGVLVIGHQKIDTSHNLAARASMRVIDLDNRPLRRVLNLATGIDDGY